MDSEKPKHDPPSDPSPEDDAARRRVERLTGDDRTGAAGAPGSPAPGSPKEGPAPGDTSDRKTGSSSGSGRSAEPVRLTERQRREARERRRQEGRGSRRARRRPASSGAGPRQPSGNPLSRGIRATWLELRRTAGFVAALVLSGLERLGPAVRFITARLLALLAAAGRGLARIGRGIAAALSWAGALVLALDRVITPRRALIAVATGGAVVLVISQFTDFRATEIGRSGYDPILDITRAPRTDVLTPTGAHSVLLLLAAAAAVAGIAGAVLTGRRVFAATIALAGAATVSVSLLVDLPKGLDVGEAAISYSEATAVLLSGFWIQLGAGLVLMVGGLGLLVLAAGRQRSTADREAGPRRERAARGGRRAGSARAEGLS